MSNNNRLKRERTVSRDLGGPEWSGGERSEPKRNGGAPKSAGTPARVGKGMRPDPEVLEKPERRRFSADYKARIVQEADGCTEFGQIGALLRREGLCSSQLSQWRKEYREGARCALRDDKRGRKRKKTRLELENEQLRKQMARMEHRLQQAEAIIEIQKKASEMLGIPLRNLESDEGV
jgi:transposase